MLFKYEHQMVQPAERWLSSLGLITKREFPSPWGICDLVGCSLKEKSVKQRITFRQLSPIGPQLRVMILSRIPDQTEKKSVSIEELHDVFRKLIDHNRLDQEINHLLKGNFVQITSKGTFQKRNGWVPLQKRLVAVELKLNRISEAVRQATSNLAFTSESYVGLPLDRAQRVATSDKITEFSERGLGLFGINREGCKVLLKPDQKKSQQNLSIQMHCVERFWRSYSKGSEV